EIFWRTDLEGQKRVAGRRLSELADVHAIRRRADHLHVFGDAIPAGELVVRADLEPDKLFRRRKTGGRKAARDKDCEPDKKKCREPGQEPVLPASMHTKE